MFFAHHPANSLQEYWWDFSVFCSSVAKETVSLFLDNKSKLVHNRQSAPKLQVISIGQFELILLSACLPYFAKTHSMFFHSANQTEGLLGYYPWNLIASSTILFTEPMQKLIKKNFNTNSVCLLIACYIQWLLFALTYELKFQ